MYTQKEKPKENKSMAAANSVEQKNKGTQYSGFVDNRSKYNFKNKHLLSNKYSGSLNACQGTVIQQVRFNNIKENKEWIKSKFQVDDKIAGYFNPALEQLDKIFHTDFSKNLKKKDWDDDNLESMYQSALLSMDVKQTEAILSILRSMQKEEEEQKDAYFIGYHGTTLKAAESIAKGNIRTPEGDRQTGAGFYISPNKSVTEEYAKFAEDGNKKMDPAILTVYIKKEFLDEQEEGQDLFQSVGVKEWWSQAINDKDFNAKKLTSIRVSFITGNLNQLQYMIPPRLYQYLSFEVIKL